MEEQIRSREFPDERMRFLDEAVIRIVAIRCEERRKEIPEIGLSTVSDTGEEGERNTHGGYRIY